MNISFVKSLQIRKSVVRGFTPSWKSVALFYNHYTFGVLTCKTANDAKGYTLVVSALQFILFLSFQVSLFTQHLKDNYHDNYKI